MSTGYPRLRLPADHDERAAFEAEARGFLQHVVIEVAEGVEVGVVFWDPVRLQQDLDEEMKAGRPFLAEPGMIVVESVTLANMERAVAAHRGLVMLDSAPGVGTTFTILLHAKWPSEDVA